MNKEFWIKLIQAIIAILCAPLIMWLLVFLHRFYGKFGGWLGITNNTTNDLVLFQVFGTLVTIIAVLVAVGLFFDEDEEEQEDE